MAVADRFEDLLTWQRMHALEIAVHTIAQRLVIRSDFRFRTQITDAAGSAARNVAEGFGRYNPSEFAHFLDISRASALEVQSCLRTALQAHYITESEFTDLDKLADRGLQALARLQRYLRSPQAKRNADRFRHSKPPRRRNGPNDPNDPNE